MPIISAILRDKYLKSSKIKKNKKIILLFIIDIREDMLFKQHKKWIIFFERDKNGDLSENTNNLQGKKKPA